MILNIQVSIPQEELVVEGMTKNSTLCTTQNILSRSVVCEGSPRLRFPMHCREHLVQPGEKLGRTTVVYKPTIQGSPCVTMIELT
jgi:hypothetical protein